MVRGQIAKDNTEDQRGVAEGPLHSNSVDEYPRKKVVKRKKKEVSREQLRWKISIQQLVQYCAAEKVQNLDDLEKRNSDYWYVLLMNGWNTERFWLYVAKSTILVDPSI